MRLFIVHACFLLRMIVNTVCENTIVDLSRERAMHDKASFCIEFDDAGVSRGGHIIWQHGTFRIPQGSVTAIVGTNGTENHHDESRTRIDSHRPRRHNRTRQAGRRHESPYRVCAAELRIRHRIEHHRRTVGAAWPDGARFGIHPITRLQKTKYAMRWNSSTCRTRRDTGCRSSREACGNASPSRRRWCRTPTAHVG